MFYRVVKDNTIVDALVAPIIKLKFQSRSGNWIVLDSDDYDGVMSGDGTHIWVTNTSLQEFQGNSVVLSEISEDEYKALIDAFDSGNSDLEYVEPVLPDTDNLTLDFIKSAKISEMSDMCNKTIVSGIDVKLSSGDVEHFDLTHDDQINLIELKDYIRYGSVESVPYHSRGGTCKIYTANDILIIAEEARKFKMYHTAYFNSLRDWINSMDSIEDVKSVFYGIVIPDDMVSDIFKSMIDM